MINAKNTTQKIKNNILIVKNVKNAIIIYNNHFIVKNAKHAIKIKIYLIARNVLNVIEFILINIAIYVRNVIINKQILFSVINARCAYKDQNNYIIIALIARNVIKKLKKIICFIVIDVNNVTSDKKNNILIVKIATNAI
jgi:hypothetical protein